MTGFMKQAVAVNTLLVLFAFPPRVWADANFVSLDGSDKANVAAYGFKLDISTVNQKVVIQISLTENAAKSFGSAELTLKRGNKTVVETTCGLVRLDGGKTGILKLTLNPQVIDGGALTIWSSPIHGQPPIKNFAGFRLSLEKLLAQANVATALPKLCRGKGRRGLQ